MNVSVNDDVQLKKAENAWKPGMKRESIAEDTKAQKTQVSALLCSCKLLWQQNVFHTHCLWNKSMYWMQILSWMQACWFHVFFRTFSGRCAVSLTNWHRRCLVSWWSRWPTSPLTQRSALRVSSTWFLRKPLMSPASLWRMAICVAVWLR